MQVTEECSRAGRVRERRSADGREWAVLTSVLSFAAWPSGLWTSAHFTYITQTCTAGPGDASAHHRPGGQRGRVGLCRRRSGVARAWCCASHPGSQRQKGSHTRRRTVPESNTTSARPRSGSTAAGHGCCLRTRVAGWAMGDGVRTDPAAGDMSSRWSAWSADGQLSGAGEGLFRFRGGAAAIAWLRTSADVRQVLLQRARRDAICSCPGRSDRYRAPDAPARSSRRVCLAASTLWARFTSVLHLRVSPHHRAQYSRIRKKVHHIPNSSPATRGPAAPSGKETSCHDASATARATIITCDGPQNAHHPPTLTSFRRAFHN